MKRTGSAYASLPATVLFALVVAWSTLLPTGCRTSPSPTDQPPRRSTVADTGSTTSRPGRLHALLINGGQSPLKNYQSHLVHLSTLIDLLRASGVDDITVMASDGPDPAPDLAVRDRQTNTSFWLIDGLPVAEKLKPEIRLENSEIPGTVLQPATRASLEGWIDDHATVFSAEDTLLLYVTDHGHRNKENLANNSIVLWGELLSVNELQQLLLRLNPSPKVVMLMSQCFSGSFAALSARKLNNVVCGYFASTAERMAYGCYPENRGKHNVGHSFRIFDALATGIGLPAAHQQALLTDRTPDVPHSTSQAFGSTLLARSAEKRGIPLQTVADELLNTAYLDELHYSAAFRSIDRLGEAFGAFSPRSLATLRGLSEGLEPVGRDLHRFSRRWREALLNLQRENFESFLQNNPFWKEYLSDDFMDALDRDDARRVSNWLLADLRAYTDAEPSMLARLEGLRTMAEEARKGAYRMDVRRAVARRIHWQLLSIAAQVYLDRQGSITQRARYEALTQCEELRLRPRGLSHTRRHHSPSPFPDMAEELTLLASVQPGWLGVDYGQLDAGTRLRFGLGVGAVTITQVHPESGAHRAGLLPGDIIVGPPNKPFSERQQIREWAVTSIVGQVRELDILRAGVAHTMAIELGPTPDTEGRRATP